MNHLTPGRFREILGLALLAGAGLRAQSEAPGLESAAERARLPLYRTIPAATDQELTLAAGEYQPAPDWYRANADAANTRYSPLTQINRTNVSRLKMAWIYHSKDGRGNIQANPVVVDGVMYAPTVGKDIVAIDAENGREIWRFQLPSDTTAVRINGVEVPPGTYYDWSLGKRVQLKPGQTPSSAQVGVGYGPAERGLAYWGGDAGHAPRIYLAANGYVLAVDAKTGALAEGFGDHGAVASSKGPGSSNFLGSVAPAYWENVLVAPNQNWVDAYDLISGRRLWSFNTLTYPVADAAKDNGGNVWGGVAMDEARGIVFVAAGDPHPNFVGTQRIGPDDHCDSVLALDARSGRLLWSFQEVVHDLWDHDTPAPPQLVTVWHHGKRVDAVAEVTKSGNTLLLDRRSGKPLFPFRRRRAPVSQVPGERTWPYQPDVELPQPFARQVFGLDDVTNLSPEARAFVLKRVETAVYGWFEPPQVDRTLIFYGVHGGAEWTGASFDPTTGWLYVSANELAWVETLSRARRVVKRDPHLPPTPGERVFLQSCALCHGESREGKGMIPSLIGLSERRSEADVRAILQNGRNAMPPARLPEDQLRPLLDFLFDRDGGGRAITPETGKASAVAYEASGFAKLLDDEGYPGTKPPWGTLNAIDLNTGRIAWKVPLGEDEKLTRRGIPKTGTENFGGAMATAGGLVFCAGTRDLNIRAFDKSTGAELWRWKLPFGGNAPPSSYQVHGRQFIVLPATGGGKLGGDVGDAYVAFALPE